MKKVLTERRLRELAGVNEVDTRNVYRSKLDARKRERHAAEKEFFGSDEDPLVTTDVPDSRLTSPPAPDPSATQPMSQDQLLQIQRDIPEEARRPVAMELYKELIEPFYSKSDLEALAVGDDATADALSQLIGWFHPAFHDQRGRPLFDNPSRLGIKIAQEFKDEDLDIVEDAEEFGRRLEKYLYDETKAEFAQNIAHRETQPRHPDYDRPPSPTQTPGTPEYEEFQRLMQKSDETSGRSRRPTRYLRSAAIKK
jgi:hypothetical protein